ncbi:MAG: prepilin-type N-terminal cleavage/methylation domain-containing protein [Planctomycetota bacterium]
MRTFRARSRRGFTLIEMTIVIAILAILAAIVLPLYQSHSAQARVEAFVTNVQMLDDLALTAMNQADVDTLDSDGYDKVPPEMSGLVTEGQMATFGDPLGEGQVQIMPGGLGALSGPVALFDVTGSFDTDVLASIDASIDDGDLATGRMLAFDAGSGKFAVAWELTRP